MLIQVMHQRCDLVIEYNRSNNGENFREFTPDDFLCPLKHCWHAPAIYIDARDMKSHTADGSDVYHSPTIQCSKLAKQIYFF
jgi:hypothetical protein